MIFSSFRFLIFFPLVLLLYFACKRLRYRQYLLLMASYVFYASWDPRFLSLIIISTLVDYVVGLRLPGCTSDRKRLAWLMVSIIVNLGILCTFKYAGFFIGSFQALLGFVGLQTNPVMLDLILPVGISFYTFQTMSYSLDIYRRKLEPTRNFIEFAVFVAFFPQLVSGPIVRAVEFLPQIRRNIVIWWTDVAEGINRFAIGFTKKVFIADNVSGYVDRIFENPSGYDAATVWMGSIGFAVQVYCDFSGYSDMAIGSARIMGFRLPENFRFPFTATNIGDFWRRWHITLYSFMRDYLYIALGGSRVGQARLLFNVLFTMTIIGLWHGANWQFVAWGFFNGLLIVGYRLLMIPISRSGGTMKFLDTLPGKILRVFIVNIFFFIGLAIFRAPHIFVSVESVWRMLIFDGAGERLFDPLILWFYGLVMVCSVACELNLPGRIAARATLPLPLQVLGYTALIVFLAIFGACDTQAFVYFQF